MGVLAEIRRDIAVHARPDLHTPIDGLLLSKVENEEPGYSLTEPLLVVMAQGGKRLLLGDQVYEYRAGQCLVVAADLPVTGHFLDSSPRHPALSLGLVLRPAVIAPLVLRAPAGRRPRQADRLPAIATSEASPELLDAVARLLRLLDHPEDARVLAPLLEQEILWRLLTGPSGGVLRQIGLAESSLSYVNRAIRWIRDHYAEPIRIGELAGLAGMSPSAFHRHFRAVTAMSPVQFQKRIRLQEARSLLVADPGDVAGIGHLVGYDSPSQFSREYRRLFGAPPGQDAARLRADAARRPAGQLP
ncbi:AraC family transcriptional regulator [Amycolatopsis alkalitolerans]|uniref:AraC family transcriptional regulator n=1 Tax=Amycolatopsis alkalitolerans TaxID=2547244 RepID=A0A5C4MBZ7_9PSEU|nr:AraC family transcriptional regulator [Amycolatopsis alkalitolerans]TNC29662.1 AraC family transcriptional regulator [Amycolatopsis alkalitolerans]